MRSEKAAYESAAYAYVLGGENICMFHVKNMEVNDFPFAVQLANVINWNMTLEDFGLMMKVEPQGCFVLFQDQERIGIATSVSFGKAGWFGNLIVKEGFRSEGAGGLLIRHAIDYLKKKGVKTIGLYAYPHLVEFYGSFGYKSDIDFLVLKGKVAFHAATKKMLKAAKYQEVPRIIDFDRQCLGVNRKKLLELILLNKRNLCYVSTKKSEITGYIAAKTYDEMVEIGPLICTMNHAKNAVLLLKTMLNQLNGLKVFTCIPKKETNLLNLLHKAGLKEDFRVVRMFLGPAIAKNCIYSAESLERG